MEWQAGDVIVEREVWRDTVMLAVPTIVIDADEGQLVTYLPAGAPFWFPAEPVYPGPGGRHPWFGKPCWEGHGKLTIVPSDGDHAVCHFWEGPNRQFSCWYLNIQEPMRTTAIGFDTQDLELDIVVKPDGSWVFKDDEVLDQRVSEGRWTKDEVGAIRNIGKRIVRDVLEPKQWWWDRDWSRWEPDPDMALPSFPADWTDAPVAPFSGLAV